MSKDRVRKELEMRIHTLEKMRREYPAEDTLMQEHLSSRLQWLYRSAGALGFTVLSLEELEWLSFYL